MPLENEYRPIIIRTEVQAPLSKWQLCGTLIANHLRSGNNLLLDGDGVLLKPDSLDRPELTTPKIITPIKTLENLGIKVGVATARGGQIIDYLCNEYGLQMKGPSIIEDGHVVVSDGIRKNLASPNHSIFVADVRKRLLLHPEFQTSWNNVRTLSEVFDMFAFCPGGFQWQGKFRASFWFFANGDKDDHEILSEVFEPVLRILAQENGLGYENDLDVSVGRMSVGNLGILSIKGKINGESITKGTAARRLIQPWVLAADGFGDTALATVTKKFKGAIIGVEGNLDVSNEPPEFLNSADLVLRDPEELAFALSHAANCLE